MTGWVTVKDITLKFSCKFRQLRILINLVVFHSYYVQFSFNLLLNSFYLLMFKLSVMEPLIGLNQ